MNNSKIGTKESNQSWVISTSYFGSNTPYPDDDIIESIGDKIKLHNLESGGIGSVQGAYLFRSSDMKLMYTLTEVGKKYPVEPGKYIHRVKGSIGGSRNWIRSKIQYLKA